MEHAEAVGRPSLRVGAIYKYGCDGGTSHQSAHFGGQCTHGGQHEACLYIRLPSTRSKCNAIRKRRLQLLAPAIPNKATSGCLARPHFASASASVQEISTRPQRRIYQLPTQVLPIIRHGALADTKEFIDIHNRIRSEENALGCTEGGV